MYISESALVDELIELLSQPSSPWGEMRHGREFNFQRGRTDVVALSVDGDILAFEAKLSRWRDALHQAYRNLCFANLSYVVLPREVAIYATKHDEEFSNRGVGLCYIDHTRLVVLREATKNKPLQPWLSERATLYVSGA